MYGTSLKHVGNVIEIMISNSVINLGLTKNRVFPSNKHVLCIEYYIIKVHKSYDNLLYKTALTKAVSLAPSIVVAVSTTFQLFVCFS